MGRTVRAITRPFSWRTVDDVFGWWTSSATYFVVRFIRAAPGCGPWLGDASTVTPRDVLSIAVRRIQVPSRAKDRASSALPCALNTFWIRLLLRGHMVYPELVIDWRSYQILPTTSGTPKWPGGRAFLPTTVP